jgi:hypothetical protein
MNRETLKPGLISTLAQVASLKLQIRWFAVVRGIYSAVFWTIAALALGWLRHAGLSALGAVLLGIWLLLSLPVLYMQLSILLDMLGYVFTGKISFYPVLQAAAEARSDDERDELAIELLPEGFAPPVGSRPGKYAVGRIRGALVSLISNTSPLSCLSTWALVVLIRIPNTAHHRVVSPRRVATIQIAAERQLYSEALSRLSVHL